MDPLQNLKIATPCSMIWERMKGNERVRHCERCRFKVYDLSAMTSAEATQLLTGREGRLCVTFFRRADGRVLTKDCRGGFSERFWARMSAAKHRGLLFRVGVAVSAMFIAGLVTCADRVRVALGLKDDAVVESVSRTRPSSQRMMGERRKPIADENVGY